MENYKIQQLVYTKLNPNQSPFEKMDFHTAFYPIDLLTSTDVLVIENHIYIPGNDEFATKQVVYFSTIKNETYLVVLDINTLPGEVDTHGRGGIFMAQIFMFPQALWQQMPSPNQLMELVADFKYHSRSQMLESSFINKENGNMLPIEIEPEKVVEIEKTIAPIESAFEIQVLLHLLDSLNTENKEQRFIVSGTESDTRTLLNKLICYLPNEQKPKIGWDTMYDGGRMMDYNKSFVAYQAKEPRGGSGSSFIRLSNSKIELAKDFKVSKTQTPFAKWISGCSGDIKAHYYVEEANLLSKALLKKEKCKIVDTWNVACFAEHNSDLVEKLFLPKCKKEFNSRLGKELGKVMSVKDKLFYFLDKVEPVSIANYLLIIIENSSLSASQIENNTPEKYIKHSPVLVLIEQLWKNEKFDIQAFNKLVSNEKLQINRYVERSHFLKSEWYLELIKMDGTLLAYYTRQYKKPKRMIKLFRRVLNMTEAEINDVGFSLRAIRKVFVFRIAYIMKKIGRVFKRKKKKVEE
jgi:hypothetical protein